MDQKPVSRPRNPDGSFAKGGPPPPASAHRKKGITNKITRDLREGAIAGFARHGSNGRGEGGFAGFCFYLAKKHPKAAARIVEKILPLTVSGNLAGLGANIGSINIVSVPSGNFLSSENIPKLTTPGLIEHDSPSDITPVEAEFTPSSESEQRLLTELEALSSEELLERARAAGYSDADGS